MTVVLAILFVVLIMAGIWLWEKMVDGAADMLIRAIAWPFAKIFGVTQRSSALKLFQNPQRFQLAADPEQVGQVLKQLPGVSEVPSTGHIAPYYLGRFSDRVRIGIGNYITTPYELEVQFTAEWPGTAGEVRYLRWDQEDPADDIDLNKTLLDTIFSALRPLDPMLYVTSEPRTPAGGPASAGPAPLPAAMGVPEPSPSGHAALPAPMRFNPPPTWPPVPAGWVPPPDWAPPADWPAPPAGWALWVPDQQMPGPTPRF